MTDERRTRQMVQYHNEGEHVFPEPECPSCRLDEALRRAGEMVAVCEPMYIAGFPQGDEAVTQVMPNALEGWAGAIQALRDMPCKCDESSSRVAVVGHNYDCPVELAKDATTSFITVMLGE